MTYFSRPNRTACDVLEEMRKSLQTLNLSYLGGLIEELQSTCSRMEAALWDQKDFSEAEARFKSLKVKIKKLEAKLDE